MSVCLRAWLIGPLVAVALVACGTRSAADRMTGSAPERDLPACRGSPYRLVGEQEGWQPRTEAEVLMIKRHGPDTGRGTMYAQVQGSAVAETLPDGSVLARYLWRAAANDRWPFTQGLVLPPSALQPGQPYKIAMTAHREAGKDWHMVVVHDQYGRLRALSARGQIYMSRYALEKLDWTATFVPACRVEECWLRACADPVVHHDVRLQEGEHIWQLPMGTVQEVAVDGRPFRVTNDAAAISAQPGRKLSAGAGSGYWSVTIIALD